MRILTSSIQREAIKSKIERSDGAYKLVDFDYRCYRVKDLQNPNVWRKSKLEEVGQRANDFQLTSYEYRSYNHSIVWLELNEHPSGYDLLNPEQLVVVLIKEEILFDSSELALFIQGSRGSFSKKRFEILQVEPSEAVDAFEGVDGKQYWIAPSKDLYAKA